MKIALVHQPIGTVNIPVHGGSIEIWTHEVAARLAKSCDVIVYAKCGPSQKRIEHNQGVEYRRIRAAPDRWLLRLLRRLPSCRNPTRPLFASSLFHLAYAARVARDLASQRCDIVHTFNFSQFVPIFSQLNPTTKIVLNMTCEWLTQLDHAMIERRLKGADLIVGCSEHITHKIRQGFPHLAERCRTVLNGVDADQFVHKERRSEGREPDARRLLFVGRVSPEKGLHVLLDALKEFIDQYPQSQLSVVGGQNQLPMEFIVGLSDDEKVSQLRSFYEGATGLSYFSQLQRQLLALGIADHVSFIGHVPYAEVVGHYHDADLLINPSFSESFGRSLIEAMACQVPVVATRVGGMLEIVEEGKTGILVEPGDARALADAMILLASDEDLSRSMGQAARRRVVRHFSWDRITEDLLNHYKDICEL